MPDDSNVIEQRLGNIEGVLERIVQRLDWMDARFEQIEQRLDRMDARSDQMDARFDRMDSRFDRMERALEERPTKSEVRTYFEALEGKIRLMYDALAGQQAEHARNLAEHQSFVRHLDAHDMRITALERRRPQG